MCQQVWSVKRVAAADFDRAFTTAPENAARVKAAGNLAGAKPGEWFGLTGWFEYDVTVPEGGWYELSALPDGGGEVNFLIDGQLDIFGEGGAAKVANVWLDTGKHTIRLSRFFWTGFSAITGFELSRSQAMLAHNVFVDVRRGESFIKQGRAKTIAVTSGGWAERGTLTIRVTNTATNAVTYTTKVKFAKSARPVTKTVALPCPTAGAFTLSYFDGDKPIATRDLRPFSYTVIDATPVPATGGALKKTLLSEVDCVKQAPDFHSYYDYATTPYPEGLSRLVERPFGSYRETGSWGYRSYQNPSNPCWFAYKFTVPAPQQPYLLEIDYPDDAARTSLFAIRESGALAYPICSGPDTGGPYQTTYQLQTHTILFWPRTTDLRFLVIPPFSDSRGAVAKFRVYRIDGELPLLKTPASGGRHYLNWYEEGTNFSAMYGMPTPDTAGMVTAAARWARAVAYVGGDTLAPTASVYQMCLFPSKYSPNFARDDSPDYLRLLLLNCEKYHLSFMADFYPESRELSWVYNDQPDPKPNFSVNRNGQVQKAITGCLFSPVHPSVERQVMQMVGEFADRYKDSPALKGIILRQMEWANHGLYNFNNLDWGYDDYTVGLFAQETGVTVPATAGDSGRFAARYDWLMAHAKEQWIAWRCDKITRLYQRIRDRLRQARPDLQVYVTIYSEYANGLTGAGIDPERLKKLDGIVLVDARAGYGRMGNEAGDYKTRDFLLNPAKLNEFVAPTGASAFLNGTNYIEATEQVARPQDMGFPAGTRATWMSGVANPSGRQYLERFAVQLAEADATMLGDGGNAYTLGQPLLREFLQEFRALPAVRFTPRVDARDPAAVWELRRAQDFLFYAVNREGYPVTLTVTLSGAGKVSRLATGEPVAVKGGQFTIALQPYQLLAYKARAGMTIRQVSAGCPPAAVERAQILAAWIAAVQAEVAAKKIPLDNASYRTDLQATADEVAAALQAGHYWRVRTLLESPTLYNVFQTIKRYPRFTPFKVKLNTLIPSWWMAGAVTRSYPQARSADADGLSALLAGSKTEPCPALGENMPLVTWTTKTVDFTPPFSVVGPQRFTLWTRLAVYPHAPRLTVTDATGKAIAIQAQSTETGLQLASSATPILLEPGKTTLTFTVEGAGQPYLQQLFLAPEFTLLSADKLRFVGYFPNKDMSNWETALGPEAPDGWNPAATFDGFVGKDTVNVRWQPFPTEMYDNTFLGPNRCPPGPPGPNMIAYTHTKITVPTARTAVLFFNGKSKARIFLNGTLLVDSVQAKYNLDWYTGRFVVNLPLNKGENHLLVKLANGDGPNDRACYLHAEISDPGDLLLEP
jgi:hypothetical protein